MPGKIPDTVAELSRIKDSRCPSRGVSVEIIAVGKRGDREEVEYKYGQLV